MALPEPVLGSKPTFPSSGADRAAWTDTSSTPTPSKPWGWRS